MNLPKVHIFFLIGILLWPIHGFNQTSDVTVTYGKTTLDLTERFSIRVVIRAKNYDVSDFPEIDGFTKGGRSIVHTTFRKQGTRGIEHTITQNYLPKKVGNFKLSPSSITVNNQSVFLPGELISVKSSGKTAVKQDTIQLIELPTVYLEDATLLLNVAKDSVFVGEGLRVSVGFYVSDLNTAGWDFPTNLNAQVEAIAQQIKPANCLESRLEITDITSQRTRINQKDYTRYTVFEAIYYPLNTDQISFKPVFLTMNALTSAGEISESRRFESRTVKVNIKPLPDHPLKDKVPVGNFYLREWLSKSNVETGTSVPYEFRILGEGNFATVNLPTPENDENFDFYPTQVNSNTKEGLLNGSRTFKFAVFPKDTGVISLNSYFKFIYFNANNATYDTLSSNVKIEVSGDKIASTNAKKNDIYAGLKYNDSTATQVNYRRVLKNIANVVIVAILISLLYMLRKKHLG